MTKVVEDKISALNKKEQETLNKIDILVKEMTGPNKVKKILLKPDNMGELMTKIVNTQSQVAALVDKVEDIEEEFANKLEQLEKSMLNSARESEVTIPKLEN
jgi:hypothetical protein